ncbi:G-protein coupled receptor 68-like [Alosa pseudoharengus]|uniref:G-protein coupled receptor 68-like n=1 Tax=Alosa pseudoharengus TaxID=34774 RepID=UPI003F8C19F4
MMSWDDTFSQVLSAVSWVILVVALPITLLAIYGLYFFIRADHVAPVYVINLLISDMVQISANPISLMKKDVYLLYYLSLMASVWFMVCIAAERYIMIAYPVFYRNMQTIKRALRVSVAVWVGATIALIIFEVVEGADDYRGVVFLLPFPLLTVFLLGSWRVLSKSRSVSPEQHRQVMGTLVLVLCIYVLLFLPFIVSSYLYFELKLKNQASVFYFHLFSEVLMSLNPMLDPILYVFMRRDAKDILWAFPCFHQFQKCRKPLETQPTNDTAETLVTLS